MNDNNQNWGNNVNNAAPIQNVTPTPMPSNGVNVAPQVMPAPTQSIPATPMQEVTPTPVGAMPNVEVTPTPINTVPTAPTQVAPAAPQSVPTPSVTPQPVNNGPVAEEVTLSPTNNSAENVTVISTKKSSVSNVILIIIIGLLVLFVFNMDKVIEYYELYMETGSLTKPDDTPTDNLANGYILIDESSSIKVENIRFYNFRKAGDTTLTFSYVSGSKYQTPSSLGIYIEVYNYNKDLLYKELFDTKNEIEKDTVRTYSITLNNDVYSDAQFALVKKYTDEEANTTSTLVCKTEENQLKYTITYTFKNNGLASYDVLVTNASENQSTLKIETEYDKVKDLTNATLANGELKYTINLENDLGEYKPLYVKDTTKTTIKNKEELKKWTCE